jgi:hypothetical protein
LSCLAYFDASLHCAALASACLPACLPPQLEEEFVRANPEWVKELEIMVTTKVCVVSCAVG